MVATESEPAGLSSAGAARLLQEQAELETAGRLATLPFTFERRRTSVVLARDGGRRLLCKGAAEEVLAGCTRVPAGVEAVLEAQLAAGNRLLALAEREVEQKETYRDEDERGLELRGFLVFADPPKEDAGESVARLRALGLELKVLTGDHERTAARVCEEVGLPVQGVVRGDDLAGLDEPGLAELVRRTTVFARVSPEQKAAIVAAQQSAGHDVAFLGDGVNDAPALHRADVGISVESAVDVAKEAADVVLLEKSLGVIADGVAEGRRIFANTMKYVLMGTSSNFGNMFSAAGASLCTQTLVVFVIRTRRVPFVRSRPSRPLLLTTLAVVGVGLALPFSPLAHVLGFRALPALFLFILVGMIVTYLALVEAGKTWFFRRA